MIMSTKILSKTIILELAIKYINSFTPVPFITATLMEKLLIGGSSQTN